MSDASDDAAAPSIAALFADEPDRLSRMVVTAAGIRFDWSRTHLTRASIAGGIAHADAAGFGAARDALFAGRHAGGGHVAERGQGAPDDVAQARMLHARMRGLIDAVEAEAIGPFRHILHLGTGAMAAGPALLAAALGGDAARYDVAVVADADGLTLERALARCDAEATLVVVASHGFADDATLLNAASVLSWLADAGVDDPYGRCVAVTADPDAAVAWGIDETRVLPFAPSVDARHAVWSSGAFAAALALGWDAFETLLEGAAAMDRHFRLAEPACNAPLIAAIADRHYRVERGAGTRATFAWDARLAAWPAWDAMLSAGPVVAGGAAADAGPVLSALREPGAPLVPVEFVAAIEPEDALDAAHRRMLLADCFAQGAALMAGRAGVAGSGDRPSTTVLFDRIDPATLGALMAFAEHRRFALSVLMARDPFAPADDGAADAAARAIADGAADALDPATRALAARGIATDY